MTYDQASIKFRGVKADINFNLSDYEDDLKQTTESFYLNIQGRAFLTCMYLLVMELKKVYCSDSFPIIYLAEITEVGEEVARWREACELEVEAGKLVIEQREKEIAMLHGELARTKSALDTANSQLLLKERLASTAIAAQAAAETSLQLADRRFVMLRERIEELMKQVEEDDCSKKERSVRNIGKLRHVCWPWQALKFPPASRAGGGAVASWVGNRNRKMMPDMEALLHVI